MHIHAAANLNIAGLQSAAAAERAATAQRATDTRRKLSDASLRLQSELDGNSLTVSPYAEQSRQQRQNPYASALNQSSFDPESDSNIQPIMPLSLFA